MLVLEKGYMSASNHNLRAVRLLLMALILASLFALAFYGGNAYREGKFLTFSFKASVILYVIVILIGLICLWITYRSPNSFLRSITWLNEHLLNAAVILIILLLSSFVLSICRAWLRLFSSLGDNYSSLLNAVIGANRLTSLFIWEWLVLASVILLIGYYYLVSAKLLKEVFLRTNTAAFLVFMAYLTSCMVICLIGLQEVLPHWLIASATQAERFVREPLYHEARLWLWVWVVIIMIGTAFLLSVYYKGQWKARYTIPFLMALAVSYFLLTRFALITTPLGFDYHWDILYRSNDSAGYLSYDWGRMNPRPPMYPLFVQWIAGNDAQKYLAGIPWNKPVKPTNNPLLGVVQYQKLFVLGASLLAAFAMMGLLKSPLPVVLFLALYDAAFYTDFFGHLLTEALAAAWLFLILAAFFGYFWKKHWLFLLFMGVGCACIYLTRPSGIFCLVFLGIAGLYGLIKNWRSTWAAVLISLLVMGLIISAPSLADYVLAGSFQPTPTFALQIVAFAVEVAQPTDLQAMPDEMSRKFLEKVLEKKALEAEEEKSLYPQDKYSDVEMLRLRYRIANHKFRMAIGPTSAQEVLGKEATMATTTAFMQRVSIILLSRHWKEYLSIGLKQFGYAMNILSRLKTPGSFLFLYLGTILCCVLVGGEAAWSSIALIAAHAVQVLLAGFFDIPTYRYIYATEFLVILAWSVLIIRWFSTRVFKKMEDRLAPKEV